MKSVMSSSKSHQVSACDLTSTMSSSVMSSSVREGMTGSCDPRQSLLFQYKFP